jgi:predicted RNA-binding Zn ribbon-like protein
MRAMKVPPAPGELDHPALTLVNSRWSAGGELVDELSTPDALRRWLGTHGAPANEPTDQVALDAVRALRAAARELLLARIEDRVPDAGAVEVVNAASAAVPTVAHLVWAKGGGPLRTEARVTDDPAASARAVIARDAIDLVAGPAHADLRACGAPGCVRLLLSDHPRRHWCSKRCGDRVRAARYYRRHRAKPVAET